MERLIDLVKVSGREYRLIENLTTGVVKVASGQTSVLFPDRTTAYNHVAKMYRRLAVDLGNVAPGATITMPMADGAMRSMTVMTVTSDNVTVIDQQSGEQMKIPRTKGQPTTQNQPSTSPAAQPGSTVSGPGVGVTMIAPGYGTVSGKKIHLSQRHKKVGLAGAPESEPSAGTGRKLTRHEIITEAETLIRNMMAKGTNIGLEELTAYMSEQYNNSRDEIYQGAKMAYDKVQWEGPESGGSTGPQTLEEIAEPAESPAGL